jgi:4-hydroxy-2-oxoheptanedioate aldolase
MSAAITEFSMSPDFLGFKSEFEAEGATFEEMSLFFSLISPGGQKFVKIGGCEAVSDFNQAISLGASDIIAPMIESRFALRKYAAMCDSLAGLGGKRFWFNIETREGSANSELIISDAVRSGMAGVIVGRGDLAESLGLARNAVDSREVSELVLRVLSEAKDVGLKTGVGGGVSLLSEENLQKWTSMGLLDHFETRKVLIDSKVEKIGQAIQMALRFEVDWLEMLARQYENRASTSKLRLTRLLDEVGRVN